MRRHSISADVSDLRGAGQLSVAAVMGATQIVEEMHRIIVRAIPLVGKPSGGAAFIIPSLVYRSIRAVTRFVGTGLDTAFAQAESFVGSPRVAARSANRDAFLGVVNGVLGDYLIRTASPLAIPMRLRKDGQPLRLEPGVLASTFAPAGRRLIVVVHGLCMTDRGGPEEHNHAASLARTLGYTPISLHYNTGRHISTNGKEFAGMLEQLLRAWPVPVDELVIMGHSMGGLVARSACYYAKRKRLRWLGKLKKLVFLGAPHHGAPLERAGHRLETLLRTLPHCSPLARLGELRSAGIKDLRYGNLIDTDWKGPGNKATRDLRTPVPLPNGVQCFAVAASRHTRSGGDGLVPISSALGRHDDPSLDLSIPEHRQFIAYGVNHFELRTSPEVYEQLYRWLSSSAG